MKKNKLILFVGLALLMQMGPTHAAASLATLQASLEALKSKLATLAQALGKINQTYIPVDELSAGQKSMFTVLSALPLSQSLATMMEAYVKQADHEGLKTFIGTKYQEDDTIKIWFANLYNGMLFFDRIIFLEAEKDTLAPNQLFQTSDALKGILASVIPVGPMMPPRDHS